MYNQWGQGFPGVDAAAQQMYWQQYYAGYGAPQQYFGYGQAMPPEMATTTGQAPAAQAVTTSTSSAAPVLPVELPKEEPPPLPAEPPPPEIETATTVEEKNKLTALQMQAAQWQQQKQWQEYQLSLVQYQQQLQQWNMQQAALLEQVNKEEAEFDVQYNDWLKQYNDWREQNKNHPNKEQYTQYENQWKQYEEQMAQKREGILGRKRALLTSQQQAQAAVPAPPAGMPPSDMSAGMMDPTKMQGADMAAMQHQMHAGYYGGGMGDPMQHATAMGQMYPSPGGSMAHGQQQYPHSEGQFGQGFPGPGMGQGMMPSGPRFQGQQEKGPRFAQTGGAVRGIRPNAQASQGFGNRPPFENQATGEGEMEGDGPSQVPFKFSQGPAGGVRGPRPPMDGGGMHAPGLGGPRGNGPFGNRAANQMGPRGMPSPSGGQQFGFGQSQPRQRFGLNADPHSGEGDAAGAEESWEADQSEQSEQQGFGNFGFNAPFGRGAPRSGFGGPSRFPQPGGGFGRGARPMLRGPRPTGNEEFYGAPGQGFGDEGAAGDGEEFGDWQGEDAPEEADAAAAFGQFGGSRFPGSRMPGRGGMQAPFGNMRGPRPGEPRGAVGMGPGVPRPGGNRMMGPRFGGNAGPLGRGGKGVAGGPFWGAAQQEFPGGGEEMQEETFGEEGAEFANEAEGGGLQAEAGAEEFEQEGNGMGFPLGPEAGAGRGVQRFERPEFRGPRPFTFQRPFAFASQEGRPRFDGSRFDGPRFDGPRFDGPRGPRGMEFGMRGGPFGQGPRPRGPVPLMALRVCPPAPKEEEFGEEIEGLDDPGQETEGAEQEYNEEEQSETIDETPEGFGVRPPGPMRFGPRGPSGEPRLGELGSMLRPRGPGMMQDQRMLQSPRFPGMTRGFAPGRGPPGVMSRAPRPGFGEMGGGRGFGLGQRGMPPRFPRFGGPHFAGEGMMGGEEEGEENYNYGEEYTNPAEEESFGGQPGAEWGQQESGGPGAWKDDSGRSADQQPKPGGMAGMRGPSADRDSDTSAVANKALKLFSEREHELIKKAAEELMQNKSLDIISKIISPSTSVSKPTLSTQRSLMAIAGMDVQQSDDPENFDDANLGEPQFETTEQRMPGGPRSFPDDRHFQGGFDRPPLSERGFLDERLPPRGGVGGGIGGFGDERRFMDDDPNRIRPLDRMGPGDRPPFGGLDRLGPGDRPLPSDRLGPMDRPMFGMDRPGPLDDRPPFGMDRLDSGERPFALDRLGPGERPPFPPDRFGPGDRSPFGEERRFPPEDRPFLGDRPEFERDFPLPPRPFGGPRGPMGFGGPMRDDMELRDSMDDPAFRGPREDRRDFGGPPPRPGFDMERRMFDDRRLGPPEWERDEMLPFGRGIRPMRPREFMEHEEFPLRPPPFGMGRGMPPPQMPFDMNRPLPGDAPQVIDYGHGQPDELIRAESELDRIRNERGARGRGGDNPEFMPHFDREFRGPPDGRRFPDERGSFEDRGGLGPPHRSRSRSPTWQRGGPEPFGHERGNFGVMHERGRDRDGDRLHPPRGGFDGDRSRSHSNDRSDREPGFGRRDREADDFRNRSDMFSRGGSQRMPPPAPVAEEIRIETVLVDDLLVKPGRLSRPDHMVVIVRGPPGAGKTYVSRLLKDKEVANGGTAPRMLCLDDYFAVEVEKVVTEPETGKKVKKNVMEYEYDAAMEPTYRASFLKSFKRQIDDCYFNFIIVDAVFDKVNQLEEFWSYAKSKGFQVYIAEVHADVQTCTKRNTHQRKQPELQKIIDGWEETPRHYIRLDIRSLLQDAAIEDVEMEDSTVDTEGKDGDENQAVEKKDEEEEDDVPQGYQKSKWELDTSEQQLDKLDGIRVGKKKADSGPQRLEDYLQLPDDYESRTSEPGKKRVRWADIEERKDQVRRREIGFVVGQTDWAKMTDESYAERALNRTKYI